MMRRFSLFVAISFLISGCSSFPFPGFYGDRSTLVVGQIEISAVHYSDDKPTLNGNHKKDIRISLQNEESGTIYLLKTDEHGCFFSNTLPSGIYSVIEIKWISPSGKSDDPFPTYMSINPNPGNLTIGVEKNSVNNLGLFEWKSDRANPDLDSQKYNIGYDEVDRLVEKYDPDKKWGPFSRKNVTWIHKKVS